MRIFTKKEIEKIENCISYGMNILSEEIKYLDYRKYIAKLSHVCTVEIREGVFDGHVTVLMNLAALIAKEFNGCDSVLSEEKENE
jgi:hypothetical protein